MSCTDTGLVLGKNAILQFYKAGQYRDFAIATDVSIDFKTETKSVKTIGDGVWKRSRSQSIGYTISLSGLIKVGDFDDPLAFDLLDYQVQFTDIQYRLIFQEGDALKMILGNALVESSQYSGPADGFATGTFTLIGNGEPAISDSLNPCDVAISTLTATWDAGLSKYAVNLTTSGSGSILRYEYTINGGPRNVTYTLPFYVGNPPYSSPQITYRVVVYPICTSGFDGTTGTVTISRYTSGGGGVQ